MDLQTIKDAIIEAWQAMTWVEMVAVAFALLYVILAAKESIWCWLAALISVGLYVYICIKAHLFAETGLQVFYLIMAVYGWYEWKFGSQENDVLPISVWEPKLHLINILGSAVLMLALGYYLDNYTSSRNAYVDSFTTIFAIVATYMVARKVLENWIYWIAIDAVSIYLYSRRGLYLTSVLYFAYTVIAIFGYFSWRKAYRLQDA